MMLGSVGCLRCYQVSLVPTSCYIQPHVPFNAWPRQFAITLVIFITEVYERGCEVVKL